MEHGLARDMGRFRLFGGMTFLLLFLFWKTFKALNGNEVVGFSMVSCSSKSVPIVLTQLLSPCTVQKALVDMALCF